MTDVNAATKLVIVEEKVKLYRNTVYSLELDGRVAQQIEDEAGLERIKKQMKNALQAIEVLEKVQEELQAPVSDG